MRDIRSLASLVIATSAVAAVYVGGCASKATPGFKSSFDSGVTTTGATDDAGATDEAGEELPGVDFGDSGSLPAGCVNLQCQQVKCADGSKTTVTGIVYDPAGRNPLYNVIVYVPNEPVKPFDEGISCDKCGVLTTGAPIATALTGADGKFVIENVPVGADIPLVMQIGKWRRQIKIPKVEGCKDNAFTDRNLTRLPKNKSEGDIPKIAIATGGCDPFECLLRNIGVEDSEFTDPNGNGRIHMFKGASGSGRSATTPEATALWGDSTKLKTYDILINSCECSEHQETKPEGSIRNVFEYANAGGRVFGSHYQYYWIDPTIITPSSPAPWKTTANFVKEGGGFGGPNAATTKIDMTFPKGDAFAQWLVNVGASSTKGEVEVEDLRYNVKTSNPPSTRWVHGDANNSEPALFFYTFNTPLTAPEQDQCGKVLFSDFHVAGSSSGANFPGECSGNTFTNQQKALEFMLFDLSSCIQEESLPPEPPDPR